MAETKRKQPKATKIHVAKPVIAKSKATAVKRSKAPTRPPRKAATMPEPDGHFGSRGIYDAEHDLHILTQAEKIKRSQHRHKAAVHAGSKQMSDLGRVVRRRMRTETTDL